MRKISIYLLKIFKKLNEDDIFSLSAQFSYYIILGIFPFIFLLLNILGYYSVMIFELLEFIKSFIPPEIYAIIIDIARSSVNAYNKPYISISILALIWTASSGSVGIINGINKAYGCKKSRNYVSMKIRGIFFTFFLIIALQMSFIFLIAGNNLIIFLRSISVLNELFIFIINVVRYVLPIVLMLLIFSLAYKFLPYEKVGFKSVVPGAAFSTLGWILNSVLFSIYISGKIEFYTNIYGNLSGFFILLIWIYISSFIFLTGAEVNALFVDKTRSKGC